MNKRLLRGRVCAPDNYELSLVRMDGDYTTPRHKHNFDQVRYMVAGDFGYGRGKDEVQQQGTIGYFPEGVSYEQRAIGHSITLLLQGGGASGAGFMNYEQLEAGHAALSKEGDFSGGVYTWTDEEGRKHNKDAYEAIWEKVCGRALVYPQARFRTPIIADSSHYEWTPTAEPGVEARRIGAFTERSTEFGFLKIELKANHACNPRGLYFILSGTGAIGREAYRAGCAAAIDGDRTISLTAATPTELVYILTPQFGESAAAPVG